VAPPFSSSSDPTWSTNRSLLYLPSFENSSCFQGLVTLYGNLTSTRPNENNQPIGPPFVVTLPRLHPTRNNNSLGAPDCFLSNITALQFCLACPTHVLLFRRHVRTVISCHHLLPHSLFAATRISKVSTPGSLDQCVTVPQRHCSLSRPIDARDSSDKLAAVAFAHSAPSDWCHSIVCSTFRVIIRLQRNSGIRHCEDIDGFKHQQRPSNRTRAVSFLSSLGPVLSVRVGYVRFATCRPRGFLYMSLE